MSSKAYTQTTKREVSTRAGIHTGALLAEKPFRRAQVDRNDKYPCSGERSNRSLAPSSDGRNPGHSLAGISIRSLRAGIQPKLKVSQPNDIYEREADRVAGEVMRMPEPVVQRKPGRPLAQGPSCRDEEEEKVQAKLADNSTIQREEKKEDEEEKTVQSKSDPGRAQEASPSAESAIESLRSGGQPLPESTRSFFEPRFGHDFSKVRVHADSRAAEAAQTVNAQAFTTGKNIVFGEGKYSPGTESGKRLLAHELTHVVQQTANAGVYQIQRARCTEKTDPKKVIISHTVSPDTIEKPGDKIKIKVKFDCSVRSGNSHIETKAGLPLGLHKPFTKNTATFERTWDGKKLFSRVGTFLTDDGAYRHRLDKILFAYRYNGKTKKSENLYAAGPKLISPLIKIKARAYKGTGKDHYHYTAQNARQLADIMMSEIGIGNASEQKAIAWAVRNQMVRLNTAKVATARDAFGDAHDQTATPAIRKTAAEILKKKMTSDITGGAIKWFSPRKMPLQGQSCKGYDCSGGLISVTDNVGNRQRVYSPGFHRDMTYVPLANVRGWFLRFYRL